MNSMPHLIFGLTKTHFLGLFGYKPQGNIIYGVLQLCIALFLFVFNYNMESLYNNGFLVGCITVLVLYIILGKTIINFYSKNIEIETGIEKDDK